VSIASTLIQISDLKSLDRQLNLFVALSPRRRYLPHWRYLLRFSMCAVNPGPSHRAVARTGPTSSSKRGLTELETRTAELVKDSSGEKRERLRLWMSRVW
jgi:hypothetical protein